MPLIRIQKELGVKHIFIAAEGIGDLATIELVAGERQVKMGTTGDEHLAAGVSRGSALSGKLVRVITDGIISGVKIASGYTVNLGDRLTIATSGKVRPFNTITPAGAISGYVTGAISGYVPAPVMDLASGLVGGGLTAQATAGALGWTSGLASGLTGIRAPQFSSGSIASIFNSGLFAGTAFNTGRVIGKALVSGGSGASVQMLVCLE